MGRVLDGYREYLRHGSDPNLQASFEKMGVFSIFDSIDAWIRELEEGSAAPLKPSGSPTNIGSSHHSRRMGDSASLRSAQKREREPDIPVSELTLEEYLYNRFIAPP